MSGVFSDTCYYVALCNPKDRWHAAAMDASKSCHSSVVTTDYVLLELGNYFCDPVDRGLFLGLLEKLREDENTSVLPASQELLEAGLSLYRERPDKAWSLTDCVSPSPS